jgi:hypothetical protein
VNAPVRKQSNPTKSNCVRLDIEDLNLWKSDFGRVAGAARSAEDKVTGPPAMMTR